MPWLMWVNEDLRINLDACRVIRYLPPKESPDGREGYRFEFKNGDHADVTFESDRSIEQMKSMLDKLLII